MMVWVIKQDDILLGLDFQVIIYCILFDFWIKYDLGISIVEVNGQILLDFKIGFGVNIDWSIFIMIMLEGY